MNAARILQAARRNAENNRAAVASLRPVAAASTATASALWKNRKKPEEMKRAQEALRALLHIPGFFPTPAAVVDRMLAECGDVTGRAVLEPSAGRGDIADAVRAAGGLVTCYELAAPLVAVLRERGHTVTEADFMTVEPVATFDYVVMNPPFERHADRAHVRHAFEFLSPGGLLVAIVGATSGAALREWADLAEDLPPGSFKTAARPTGVNVTLIVKAK